MKVKSTQVNTPAAKEKETTKHNDENNVQDISQTDATEHNLSVIAVEAEPCNFAEIPNDFVDAIHGLVAAGPTTTSEHLAATTLRNLKPSPFYNMETNEEPADKAFVLLKFTQRSLGKQILNGFRIVTDHVEDACDTSAGERYGTIACYTPEKTRLHGCQEFPRPGDRMQSHATIEATAHGRPIHRIYRTHLRRSRGPRHRNGQAATPCFHSQPRKRRYIHRGCMATEEVPTYAALPYTDVEHRYRALLQSMLQTTTAEQLHRSTERCSRACYDITSAQCSEKALL